jgi:Holliday junction resolvasome RuvABC endonuclease subunit
MNVLGIDCSTTKFGYSVYDRESQKILDCGFSLLPDDWYEKDKFLKKIIKLYVEDYKVGVVVLETNMKMFNTKTSSATLMQLAKINGFLISILYDVIDKNNIIEVHPSSVRKSVIGKAFELGTDTKEFISKFISEKFPDVAIRRTKQNNLAKGVDDMLDAIILSLYSK